jgi:hypothetical protein
MGCLCRELSRPGWRKIHGVDGSSDSISAAAASAGPALAPVGPLLPEIAQLQWLQELEVEHPTAVWGRLPTEWGLPGAFPRLQR